jgi:hypothetical protein
MLLVIAARASNHCFMAVDEEVNPLLLAGGGGAASRIDWQFSFSRLNPCGQ